jgi:hypothetical protein
MPDLQADINELIAKDVQKLLSKDETGERPNITAKTCELGVLKDRLYRRLKSVGPRMT